MDRQTVEVPIWRVSVTVKVRDRNGSPVPGFRVRLRRHGGDDHEEWDLGEDGAVTEAVYATACPVYFWLRGTYDGEPVTALSSHDGIKDDLTLVFQFTERGRISDVQR